MFHSKCYFKSLIPAVTWFVDGMGAWEIPVATQFSEMILVIWGYPWVDLHLTYSPPLPGVAGIITPPTQHLQKKMFELSSLISWILSFLCRRGTLPFSFIYCYGVTRSGHSHHFFEKWELLNLLWYLPWFLPKLDGQDLSSSPSETSLGENWEIRCWNILLNTQDTPD